MLVQWRGLKNSVGYLQSYTVPGPYILVMSKNKGITRINWVIPGSATELKDIDMLNIIHVLSFISGGTAVGSFFYSNYCI